MQALLRTHSSTEHCSTTVNALTINGVSDPSVSEEYAAATTREWLIASGG